MEENNELPVNVQFSCQCNIKVILILLKVISFFEVGMMEEISINFVFIVRGV